MVDPVAVPEEVIDDEVTKPVTVPPYVTKNSQALTFRNLFCDTATGYPDYKKVALFVCALAQTFSWIRLSLNEPVNNALLTPQLWITFYVVIAGHDLLNRGLKLYGKMKSVDLNGDDK